MAERRQYPRMPVFEEDWGEAFIGTMRAHMEQLYDSVDVEDSDDPRADPFVLSGQPFCGCEDCDERERYLLAMILTIEGYESGDVRLVDVDS